MNTVSFKRKLLALKHESLDNLDLNDEKSFRSLIIWLEDQHIRHYKIEERVSLRNVENSAWEEEFLKYLTDVDCPVVKLGRPSILDWLITTAVTLEYQDNVEKVGTMTAEKYKELMASKSAKETETNPFDLLDFESAEFKAGVQSLAGMLGIPPHIDHKMVMKAVCLLIIERFDPETLAKAHQEAGRTKREYIKLEEVPVGAEMPDNSTTTAARILRLLHIRELRVLQTQINSAIVAVQSLTADPKTDERLGKVGIIGR